MVFKTTQSQNQLLCLFIVITSYSIHYTKLYENWVAIDKGDQAWHDKLKQTIDALRQDGTLAKISEKWIGSDVTQEN